MQTTQRARFSVLIPTRNRAATLESTLRSCLVYTGNDLEVVVSDNQSDDDTAAVIAACRDPRVRLVRPPSLLSMSSNFAFALEHASNDYIMHLGDDDGLVADAIPFACDIIEKTQALAICSRHAVYHWPNSLFVNRRNILTVSNRTGFERRSSARQLSAVLCFRAGYHTLPSTYGNFIHKSVIAAASSAGSYYRSMTPDCYSAFANAAVLDDYVVANRAITIAGISGRSNGGLQFVPNHSEEAKSWKRESDHPFHACVAYCNRSLELIVAESFLQARDVLPALKHYDIDIARLAHVALREAPEHSYAQVAEAVADTLRRNGKPDNVPAQPPLSLKLERVLAKARQRVDRLLEGYRRVDCKAYNVSDIAGACRLAQDLR